MKPVLHIGNRNYSSWSLRPWLVLKWSGREFETRLIPLDGEGYGERRIPAVLAVSPTGTVPALRIGANADDTIADSLAISEWAAERAPHLWPADPIARAHARAAACEMHAGFAPLRSALPCNIRRRANARELASDVRRDVERIEAIWSTLRARFGDGGPYLFGKAPTIADAFFTPVATRFRTYGVELRPESRQYVDAVLGQADFLAWEAEAVVEPWTIEATEAHYP